MNNLLQNNFLIRFCNYFI